MKPRTIDATVERSHKARVIPMTIAEDGLPKLMSMLTKMYNDPALAVIREYITNAIDANIESGTQELVQVTLPSELGEPMFIIRDFGPGMDENDIENIYSKYVMSTKSDSNDYAGMFGIGSKSGLAYTSQILVESVKNGVKTSTTITRTATAPEVSIDRVTETDQPNGTTVKVPVADMNSFNSKARHHFGLLRSGLLLVNGEDIGGNYRDEDLGGGVYLGKQLRSSYVLMGNVPYGLPDDINSNIDQYGYKRLIRNTPGNFIFEVELGEFMPAPPREGLELTDDDIKRLKRMVREADKKYLDVLTTDVRNAPDVVTTLKRLYELRQVNYQVANSATPLTVDGFRIDGHAVKVPKMVWDSEGTYTSGYPNSKNTVHLGQLMNGKVTWFTNVPDDMSPYYFKKTKEYCQYNTLPLTYVGVKSKSDIPTGVPADRIVDFSEVKSWSRPKVAKGTTKTVGVWTEVTGTPHRDNWSKGNQPFYWSNTKSIDPDSHGTRALVYVSPSDSDEGVTLGMIGTAVENNDVLLIKLGKNRWEKFEREFPEAMWIKDWYNKHKDDLLKGFDEDSFRTAPRSTIDLDTELHKRYNERVAIIKSKREKAIAKLGSTAVQMMSTGHDPELQEISEQIAERYPYAPSSIYYGSSKSVAQEYCDAMDFYYKEKKND